MVLMTAAVVVVARVVPASAAAVEIVMANPTGVSRDDDSQSARADRDAAFGKEFPQAFHGAANAFLRGIVGSAERGADFAEGFVLKITKQDGGAVGVVEFGHRFVEDRFNVCPIGGGGVHGIQLSGDLFAQLAAGFAPDDINGFPAGDLIKPRGQDGVRRELRGDAGKFGERGLGNLLGQLRRADLPECGGIDKVHMTPGEGGEGVLGVVPGVAR